MKTVDFAMSRRSTVFIVGTGRSGTNFLTQSLIRHRDVSDLRRGRENPWVFRRVTGVAVGTEPVEELRAVIRRYRIMRAVCPTRVLVDQSHPNLWHVEHLMKGLAGRLYFAALVRDPRGVVASMLNHSGVARWTREWEKYGVPNRFIGVDETNLDRFRAASLAGRCAYRWLSHVRRIRELRDDPSVPLSLVHYEDLLVEPTQVVRALLNTVGGRVDDVTDYESKLASLSKWEQVLSSEQVDEVCAIATSTDDYSQLGGTVA
jgi:hypothetical protein